MDTSDRSGSEQGSEAAVGAEPGKEAPAVGLRRATGRGREEWFALLDEWGAAGRPFREIADWMIGEHGISHWWAQKLIVEYEQARGLRPPGVRPDGTFSVGASKTVGVEVDRLFMAFTDDELRERWLPGATMHVRESSPGRRLRCDWEDSTSRVEVDFTAQGAGKSHVVVQHDRLPDAASADRQKTFWRERLTALKTLLEG